MGLDVFVDDLVGVQSRKRGRDLDGDLDGF